MSYSYWTNEERQRLLDAVQENLNECKVQRINWDTIAQKVPTRTREQCKSYYTNILKKKAVIDTLKYYVWSNKEVQLLRKVAPERQFNWKVIRDLYFPNMTPAQVSGKYHYLVKRATSRELTSKCDNESGHSESAAPTLHEIDCLAKALVSMLMAE